MRHPMRRSAASTRRARVDGQLATQERCYTTGLGSAEGNADEIGTGFPMLEAIGEDSKGEGLGVSDRLIARCAIGENALEVGDLGDPPTVVFAINFEGEMHGSLGAIGSRRTERICADAI